MTQIKGPSEVSIRCSERGAELFGEKETSGTEEKGLKKY